MKISIRISNSFSVLFGDPENLQKAHAVLWDALSYITPGSGHMMRIRTGKFRNLYTHLITPGYEFPAGLTRLAVSALMKRGFEVDLLDTRLTPEVGKIFYPIVNPLHDLRHYQEEAVERAIEKKRGILELATGTGKSLIIYSLIKKLGLKTLILVPSLSILGQMHKQLVHHFGEKNVGMCGGGKKQTGRKITIGTPQSVQKHVYDLNERCELLICDEAHHASAKTIRTINQGLNNVYYRYYFTATAYRNSGDDMELAGVIGTQKIYEYTTRQAIEDGFLTPPIFLIYECEHNFDYTSSWAEEMSALTTNEKYNRMVANLVISLKGRKILVFVDRIEHGELLERYIPGALFVNGEKDSNWNQRIIEDFAKGAVSVLIATKIVGEGVDTVWADTCVLAGTGKARSDVVQKVGRMLRPLPDKDYSVLIDFTHDGAKFLSKHHKERMHIYKNYNTKIVHMETKCDMLSELCAQPL